VSATTRQVAGTSVAPAVARARELRRAAGLPASLADDKALARVRVILDRPHWRDRRKAHQSETQAS